MTAAPQRPDVPALLAAVDTTWPAAAMRRHGPWILREGRGGGKRVSAATAEAPVTDTDIAEAEAAMAAMGQDALFMIRKGLNAGDDALDATLQARGYRVVDPVVLYLVPLAVFAYPLPYMAAFSVWPPLAVQTDLWAAAGIGPGRIAVMHRAAGPKTTLLSRTEDRASGVAYVALDSTGKIAMLHALEVAPHMRRQKAARHLLHASALWAQEQGADWLALAVTEANEAARALYASLQMDVVGSYHYRTA